jgi:hypothetical protein
VDPWNCFVLRRIQNGRSRPLAGAQEGVEIGGANWRSAGTSQTTASRTLSVLLSREIAKFNPALAVFEYWCVRELPANSLLFRGHLFTQIAELAGDSLSLLGVALNSLGFENFGSCYGGAQLKRVSRFWFATLWLSVLKRH